MTVWESIRNKHSIRNYKDKPLPEAVITQILDAGRRSQSGFNSQPWRFVAVTDWEKLQQLAYIGRSVKHVARCAMCVLILTPPPETAEWHWRDMFDAGQAAAYMQLAAHELGVGSCPGTVYSAAMARQITGFPDDWDLKILVAFGYPDEEQHPPRPPISGKRITLDDVVHRDTWHD